MIIKLSRDNVDLKSSLTLLKNIDGKKKGEQSYIPIPVSDENIGNIRIHFIHKIEPIKTDLITIDRAKNDPEIGSYFRF